MKRKDKRNESIVMLHNLSFPSRKIGKIMKISYIRASTIVNKYNNEELQKKYRKCAICGSKEELIFDKGITICKNCVKELTKIV